MREKKSKLPKRARESKSRQKSPAAATEGLQPPSATPEFSGFESEAVAFLVQLSVNNEREWFKANQPTYERLIREPALAFVRAVGKELPSISPHFSAVDKKVGGALMRPQRDTRFSVNKEPYKTNVGIHFRHMAGKDVHAPGFYVHIDPEEVFVGVGLWHPESAALRSIREALIERPADYRKAVSGTKFKRNFEFVGDSLKRPPQGIDPAHALITELKRKDHIALSQLSHEELYSPLFVKTVLERFRAGAAYMKFLHAALGLSF